MKSETISRPFVYMLALSPWATHVATLQTYPPRTERADILTPIYPIAMVVAALYTPTPQSLRIPFRSPNIRTSTLLRLRPKPYPPCCSRSGSYRSQRSHQLNPKGITSSPSLSPIHNVIIRNKRRHDVEYRALEAPPRVEDGGVTGASEGVLAVAREGVGGYSLLREGTQISPPSEGTTIRSSSAIEPDDPGRGRTHTPGTFPGPPPAPPIAVRNSGLRKRRGLSYRPLKITVYVTIRPCWW